MAKTRRHWIRYRTPLVVENDLVVQILNGKEPPPDPMEKADQLLLYLHGESKGTYGARIGVDAAIDYPTCSARSPDECMALARHLAEDGYLQDEMHGSMNTRCIEPALTMSGWELARELQATRAQLDRAFVVMSFSEEMTKSGFLEGGLKPALDDCGYKGDRLQLPPTTDTLDLAIIADIKRSGLIVADFTDQKRNVYYEAGYAMGLGTPVIRTCRKDAMSALEFDVRQYPVIEWEASDWPGFTKRFVDYATAWGYLAPEASGPG
jgi:hypothetical protein